ncbi:glycoside hydrolase family 6 protein [Catellatospora methionotrophica]|uniref:glycoside hydrolase family 6 protein n=1 Tax=Catellatospora methionotrophica TaxID=121620 RepID=UPI0033DF9BCD
MRIPIGSTLRRRLTALLGASALAATGLVAVATPAHAAVSCQVTYTKAWDNGSGFGANLNLTNTGDPLTSWSLTWTWPGNQGGIQGWSANYAQSGQNVTATSLSYNGSLGTGASTGIGFNASYSGTNTNPSNFAVNGVSCGGTTPTVSLVVSPTSVSVPEGGTATYAVRLSAQPSGNVTVATTAGSGDTNLTVSSGSSLTFTTSNWNTNQNVTLAAAEDSDTANGSRPFTVAASGLSSVTVNATEADNDSTTTQSLVVSSTAVSVPEGGTASYTVRLAAQPSGNVTVTNTAGSGDTSITVSSGASLTFTTSNWSTPQTVTLAAAEDSDTTAGTRPITVASSGLTSVTVTATEADNDGGPVGPRADNPYSGAGVYVNPQWRANALAEPGGSRIANQPTGVWFDRISALTGNGSPTTGTMGLADHLDQAVIQDAANGSAPMVIQIVVYNLPGRDCAALASNGELGPTELPRYKSEYIDPMAAILARPAYANLRIVAIIEIDSLPNLVTNVSGRPTATAMCDTMLANRGYVDGVGYALNKLGAVPNVYNYIDAGHHGWLGWDDNFGSSANMMFSAATASGSTAANVHGFIANTANTSALTEPYVGTITEQLRQTSWIDWNRYNDELTFAQAFRQRLIQSGFSSSIGMLIDTSRNGWGSCVQAPCQPTQATRPTAASTSTDPNTFVNSSRIDRRIHKGNWCNQAGAGLGERPRAAPATGIDAYVWIKPPGESDGSSSLIPNEEGKGFDRMCDPTYPGNARNGNSMSGALPNAPVSGHWFSAQFQQLMANAYPPLS